MADEIKKAVLRPEYRISRQELMETVEQITGQKPKPGAHSVTIVQSMDGKSAKVTWVDAANGPFAQSTATKSDATKSETVKPLIDAETPRNS